MHTSKSWNTKKFVCEFTETLSVTIITSCTVMYQDYFKSLH